MTTTMTAGTNARDFILWVLPDAEAAGANWEPNPEVAELDPAVQGLFAEVECRTGVPRDWLAKAAGLVVDGLGGLQCLWFLHGAGGTIQASEMGWPKNLPAELDLELSNLRFNYLRDLIEKHEARTGSTPELNQQLLWTAGYFEVQVEGGKWRRMKLGKWLRKQGASAELVKAFDTRRIALWDWRVSADPLDVLTMSFRRPWTSCMRPPDPERGTAAGEAEYGPLTDMAAGAAVMFFYRPGATQPAGRVLIRPGLDVYGNPVVLWCGDRVYGSGPGALGPDDLERLLAPYLEPHGIEVQAEELCALGEAGNALTRGIYSDVDNTFCRQSEDEYLDAYEGLGTAGWPEPALDGSQMRSVALQWAGEVPSDVTYHVDVDVHDLVDAVTDTIVDRYGYSDIFQMLQVGIGGEVEDALYEWGEDVGALGEDIVSDITYGVRLNLQQNLREAVDESPVDVLVVPSKVSLTLTRPPLYNTVAQAVAKLRDLAAQVKLVPPLTTLDELGVTADVPLDTRLWYVAVSRAFLDDARESLPDVLTEAAVAVKTYEPGEWEWGKYPWED